jgi:putative transposase
METLLDFAKSSDLRVRAIECARAQHFQAFQPDIACTVSIRMVCMAALLANELGLIFPVRFFGVSTPATALGGVLRVHSDQRNTGSLRFVGQKAPKLREAPTVQVCPLPLSGPDPLTNAAEVFDGNRAICAFRGLDYAFRNTMVYVGHEACLAVAALLEQALGRLCTLLLELAAQGAVAMAHLVDGATRVTATVGIESNFDNPHIHAERVHRLDLFLLRHFHGDVQEPLPIPENQIGFTSRKLQKFALRLAADKRHLLPSTQRPDAHCGFRQIQTQDAGIVSDAAVVPKEPLHLPVQLVGVRDLGSQQAHHLRRKRKLIANQSVELLVNRKPAELLGLPGQFREPIHRTVGGLQRLSETLGLRRSRQEFHLHGQLHGFNIFKYLKTSTGLRRNNHSVSRLIAHFVFVVKYRRSVITPTVWASLRKGFRTAAKRLGLVESNHDENHVHLVVEYPPSVSASEAANALKGNSSFAVRRDCKQELHQKLWGSAFWTPSFFVAASGGAPIEILKLHVQSQQTKAALMGGVSTQKF